MYSGEVSTEIILNMIIHNPMYFYIIIKIDMDCILLKMLEG